MVDRLQASAVTENSISEGRHRSNMMYDDDDISKSRVINFIK